MQCEHILSHTQDKASYDIAINAGMNHNISRIALLGWWCGILKGLTLGSKYEYILQQKNPSMSG